MSDFFLKNDELIVKINSFGAQVLSVLDKKNYREYMWYGDSSFWGRTSPVLFPFVGSLKDKIYICKDKAYHMGQHGFARDMEFELVNNTDTEIWFELNASEETMKRYPYNFKLTIGYELCGRELRVIWKVKNNDDGTMYFSIGAHPAFLCPIHGENSKEGYKLYFEGVDEIHHHGNDVETGLAIMEEDLTLQLNDGRYEIKNDTFDRCTYMIEGNQTKCVGIEDAEGRRIVDVNFDTPLFAIWSPEKKNAPFICIEPWYGRCDATGFNGKIEDRDYTQSVTDDEEFEGGYSMRFYTV